MNEPIHTCQHEDKIRQMEIDLAVAKNNISEVKKEISEIKSKLDRTFWFIITTLIGVIVGILLNIFNK